jgi:hypothetical protein
MSSLMVDFIISLDGYAAADGWPDLWGMGGPEYFAWLNEDAEYAHTTLMGATTYRLMSGFADDNCSSTFPPSSTGRPASAARLHQQRLAGIFVDDGYMDRSNEDGGSQALHSRWQRGGAPEGR